MAVAGLCTTVDAQTLRDRGGSYMGKVESDGSVRDRGGSYRGKVESDGTIRDRSGSYRGKFEGGVKRKYAAAILFFELL